MPDPGKPSPRSQDDWTVHAINIHGAFLEAWCRDLVDRVPGWSLRYYNYPVEWLSDESSLDVRADCSIGSQRVSLLIECKKHNPDFTEWVFFRKRRIFTATPSPVFHLRLDVDAGGRVTIGETAFRGFPLMSVVAEDGRETRGNYVDYTKGDKTRTSSHAIYEAARQVCLAYRAITTEEVQKAPGGIQQYEIPYHPRQLIFVPVIVTTARLHVCEFEPTDVDPVTGELPFSKARLSEVRLLRYEFAMPRSLQWPDDPPGVDHPDWSEPSIRQWVLVINAAYLERFLQHYAEHLKEGIHMVPFPDQPLDRQAGPEPSSTGDPVAP